MAEWNSRESEHQMKLNPTRRALTWLAVAAATGVVTAAGTLLAGCGSDASHTVRVAGGKWSSSPQSLSGRKVRRIVDTTTFCHRFGDPRVVDVRGPYVAMAYAAPSGASMCLVGAGVRSAGTVRSASAGRSQAGGIQEFVLQIKTAQSSRLTILYGRLGAGVSAVAVRRSAGSAIAATIHEGWYLAWWPQDTNVVGLTVKTAAGRRSLPVPAVAQPKALSCGSPKASCAVSGAAS